MTSKSYDKALEIIYELEKEGYEYEIPAGVLKAKIMKNVGADQRTIKNYVDLMTATKMLQYKGGNRYWVIHGKTREELVEMDRQAKESEADKLFQAQQEGEAEQ